MPQAKYKARKVETGYGTFDSKKEYARYLKLLEMEKAGEISNIQRQVKFELIPKQELKKPYIQKGRMRSVAMPIHYIADFTYHNNRTGEDIVEDVKGYKTPEYTMKYKLMLYIHGIQIKEV